MMRRKTIGCPCMHAKYFMLHKVFCWAKLSNKQSAKVICIGFTDLEQHTTRDKKPCEHWNIISHPRI